ncbi:MAG: hypothetical protein ACK56I_21675, partial [bacterium]
MKANNRIMMVFRSKTHLQIIMKTLELVCGNLQSAVFDGDSSAAHMKNFVRLDEFLTENGIMQIAFTSKVTVGADCQVPIHRIYGF